VNTIPKYPPKASKSTTKGGSRSKEVQATVQEIENLLISGIQGDQFAQEIEMFKCGKLCLAEVAALCPQSKAKPYLNVLYSILNKTPIPYNVLCSMQLELTDTIDCIRSMLCSKQTDDIIDWINYQQSMAIQTKKRARENNNNNNNDEREDESEEE
jgi:hypothetical protein